ncbi:hypothetical protein TNCV_4315341 [Trichonephila clavipes]|nr:hypothetical protein TNCV_4315341 [Trichonephila clavipes]
MYSPEVEPSPYGTAVSVANHCTSWLRHHAAQCESCPNQDSNLTVSFNSVGLMVSSALPKTLLHCKSGLVCEQHRSPKTCSLAQHMHANWSFSPAVKTICIKRCLQ